MGDASREISGVIRLQRRRVMDAMEDITFQKNHQTEQHGHTKPYRHPHTGLFPAYHMILFVKHPQIQCQHYGNKEQEKSEHNRFAHR